MKIKSGFVIRELLDQWVVIPVGQRANDFQYMIALNETGATLWKQLADDRTESGLVSSLCSEYDVDRETAEKDVCAFLASAREKGVLAE